MLKLFQVTKANSNSIGKFSQHLLLNDLNVEYIFCLYKPYSNQTKKEDFEKDWFKKLTVNDSSETKLNSFSKTSFNDLTQDEKRNEILRTWKLYKEQGCMVPNEITDKFMNLLLRSESYKHLKDTFAFLCKKESYIEIKKFKQEKLKKLKEENQNIDSNYQTNYPGFNTFMKRLNKAQEKEFYRSRLLSSIVNGSPSIVLDFRYENEMSRFEIKKSLYRQLIETMFINRTAPDPFVLHFCNYNRQNEFNQMYSPTLGIDENLILDTNKSYLDVFPREKLVYLSNDAPVTMRYYDPNKVYIVGAIVDRNSNQFKYASYSQAKKDNIQCVKFPLDQYVKWKKGTKNLNINHVVSLLLKLYHGKSWKQAILESLPMRKMSSD